MAWYDPTQPQYGIPPGTISGLLTAMVVLAAIVGYWIRAAWDMPAVLDTMLSASWGFAMALDSRSLLKGILVVFVVANVLVFVLAYSWVPPALSAIAIQGFTQYVVSRAKAQPPL